jgi:acyl-coenzyme A synthetase/AMP-(fatty) acid ligase
MVTAANRPERGAEPGKRRRTYEVRDELPRTDSGKLLERVLRDEHWESRGQSV